MDGDRGKVLVVLTHRLGDIVQVFPALRAIKQGAPKTEVHFVAYDGPADALGLCPWVDKVHTLPVPASPGENEALAGVLRGLAAERFKHVFNLMPTMEAARIARAAAGEGASVMGRVFLLRPVGPEQGGWPALSALPVMDDRTAPMFGEARWWRMLLGLPSARAWQPFHLSEYYLGMVEDELGIKAPTEPFTLPADAEAGRRALAGECGGVLPPRPWLALQLGASKGARVAPEEWLARFAGEFLAQSRGTLVLTGQGAEIEKGRRLKAALGPRAEGRVVVGSGQMPLAGLAGLLAAMDLVVSVDTLTLHLAAAVGAPVLGLYPASAMPGETGPLADGQQVIWTPGPGAGPCGCREACQAGCWAAMDADYVAGAALERLGLQTGAQAPPAGVVRAQTRISGGDYRLEPMGGRSLRAAQDEALSCAARAWARGLPTIRAGAFPEAAEAFGRLARGLEGPAEAWPEALRYRDDPADWLRAQGMHALTPDGRLLEGCIEQVKAGCRHMAESLAGR